MRYQSILRALLVFTFFSSLALAQGPNATKPQTVVDALKTTGNHKILLDLLNEYGLAGALSGEGEFTVLAPTDRALAGLPSRSLFRITGPFDAQAYVQKILTAHVLKGSWTIEQLAKETSVKALNGVRVEIEKTEKGIKVNGLDVMPNPVPAKGGMVYSIPKLMMPQVDAKPTTDTKKLSFPKIEAASLSRTKFVLPGAFEQEFNLVLVAFEQIQQVEVDTWIPAGEALESAYSNFRYYELPTIQSMGKQMEEWVDNQMRAGIPSPTTRARTITLYTDLKKFLPPLGIDKSMRDRIHAFLVKRDGSILWHAQGPLSQEAAKQAMAFMKKNGKPKQKVQKAKALTLTTFDEGEPEEFWRIVNDGVMGGRSKGYLKFDEGKVIFTGKTNTNGGGFTSFVSKARKADRDWGLTGKETGLTIRYKTDGRGYDMDVRVSEGSWRSGRYRYRLPATPVGEWQEVSIPFADFYYPVYGNEKPRKAKVPLDPSAIRRIGLFIFDKVDGPFRMEIDWIRAYTAPAN